MTPYNLAVVFGPNVLRPREETAETMMTFGEVNKVIELMILSADKLFPEHSQVSISFLSLFFYPPPFHLSFFCLFFHL